MLTVKQLQKQAKAKGIKGYSRLRKAQLIKLLSRAKLVPEILQSLITEEQWKGTSLDLNCKDISDEGTKALAEWGGHTLYLHCNHICDEGAKALAKWGGHTLDLADNHIGLEGANALAKWSGTNLDLSGNQIGNEGARVLAQWSGTILYLSWYHIGNEGLKVLAQWPGTILYLNGSDICRLDGTKVLTENWQGISLYLNGVENAEVKKRYEESVKLLLNEYFCKDVTIYVICKFLDIN